MRVFVRCAAVTGLMLATPLALAGDWVHGISTGFGGLALDGDIAFDTANRGTIDVEVDLDAGDVADAMSSALALGGFSKTENMTISYSAGVLDLEGDTSANRGDDRAKADLGFKAMGAEIMMDYTFAKQGSNSFGVIAGVRYSKQESDLSVKLNGDTLFEGELDEDWTDVVAGLSHTYAFSPTMSWRTAIDYGFGGSDGTTHLVTGISKIFAGHWLVGLNLDYKDVQYENGTRGTGNFYNYEVEETKLGLGIGYIFN
jgi:hypothetical protein